MSESFGKAVSTPERVLLYLSGTRGRCELGVMEASGVGRSGWVARFTVETGGRGSGVWRRTRVERMSTCMEKIFDLSKNSLDNEGHKYSCVWVSYHLPLSIAMLERQI